MSKKLPKTPAPPATGWPPGLLQGDSKGLSKRLAEKPDALQHVKPQPEQPDLAALVRKAHKAKGRYHTQLAMCDLYDACDLPNFRPGSEPADHIPDAGNMVEPVGFASSRGLERIKDFDITLYGRGGFDYAIPLYTSPPQRKPLTEFQLDPIWRETCPDEHFCSQYFDFAKAIEKAHGIGDKT